MTAIVPLERAPVGPREFSEVRAGNLGVRLARDARDIDAAQALRFAVFYGEMGAVPSIEQIRRARDFDGFDAVADHMLVIDHDFDRHTSVGGRVVGTYRLIRREAAQRAGGFYSSAEYDISPLTELDGRLLELGRSCVDAGYRTRAVMQLLWRGIAAYVFQHQIDLMFGCASLPSADPEQWSDELTFLYHNYLAPPALRLMALPERHVEMRRKPPEQVQARRAIANLPPLIKGYLRLGGFVGDGAVIDAQFNTTDVAVVVKCDLVTDKYYRHYERKLRDCWD